MGKIEPSNIFFEGKKKVSWNKGLSKQKNTIKIFSPKRKKLLNRNLESCTENPSVRKILFQKMI